MTSFRQGRRGLPLGLLAGGLPARQRIAEGPRVALEVFGPAEARRVHQFCARNRAFLAPWEVERPEAYFTELYWREELVRSLERFELRHSIRAYVVSVSSPGGPLCGVCNLNNIVMGALRSGTLGYSVDEARQGEGLMREAVGLMVTYAFERLGLHRVAANYMPCNERSERLLASLGFRSEGLARDYLRIAGRWEDHVLTARLDDAAERALATPSGDG